MSEPFFFGIDDCEGSPGGNLMHPCESCKQMRIVCCGTHVHTDDNTKRFVSYCRKCCTHPWDDEESGDE